MNFCLRGHDRENGVRELLICLFPEESHIRTEEPGNDGCVSTAETRDGIICTSARVYRAGRVTEGFCDLPAPPDGTEEYKRVLTYCIKTALYRALLPWAGPQPWGSLTGVKPAKPVRLALREGLSEAEADRWLASRYDVEPRRRALCIAAARQALAVEDSLLPREIQVYIGIPFCPAKCSYCSFVSNDITRWGHLLEPYFAALMEELSAAGTLVRREKLPVGSFYMGGGTPTTLSAIQLDALLSATRKAFGLADGTEVTVEAGRPETIDEEKLDVLKARGVTRVSVNPQTMRNEVLQGVGRRHTAADVERAYAQAQARNFIINMDLIAGLPGDDEAGLLESVRRVIALAPQNITIHSLARKKGAKLRFGPAGELAAEMLDRCYDLLAAQGYRPYYLYRQKYSAGGLENVGFCRGDTASRYNVCMMEELSDVLALGAGGVSKLCAEGGRKIVRVTNPKYPLEYIRDAEAIAARKCNLLDIPISG
ncbi:MAG: coproporphyrinogen dehydrogenase HemZ [Clostridiaceae bacterium]|nr:coproporphyrinogen dehydrogenase HemZ [Clostridiaceae bacterium]